ncbi:stage V sporulation protein AA [Thermohalobacter berrensis]|uniref:Stage V sporulation protein AA domain-containing protein n=1 Tax=Thermohalobacter berrensis TaxID=99594 RepID=A0A419TB72_9FIRM|nr:stage V sporulation protein AA [Thermohalobacter berrensis]RKD34705.1 hypothetical protein BET03_02450 [Thermohalobacter berrensis]
MKDSKVFLQLEPKIKAKPGQFLTLKDLATVYCLDTSLQKKLQDIKIYRTPKKSKTVVVSVLDIIEKIKKNNSGVDIVVFGNPEILVDIGYSDIKGNITYYLRILAVCIVLFIGAGLTIINFHEDVDMESAHKNIYYLVTGEKNEKPYIIQIPYSIGIGLGMATFFNHIFRKRWKKEPSPLEVEMYLYNKNLDNYILDNEKGNKNNRR